MSAHGCSFAQDRSNFGYATAKAEQPAQDSFIFWGLQDSKLDRWTALTYQSRDLLFLQVSWSELQTAVGFCFFSLNDRVEKEEPDEEKEVEENMTKRHSGREETRKAKRTSKTLQWVQQNEECLAMSKADAQSQSYRSILFQPLRLQPAAVNLFKGKLSIEGFMHMKEKTRMALCDLESHQQRFGDRMAAAADELKIIQNRLNIIQNRLHWHENVRDTVSAMAVTSLLDEQSLPRWLILRGQSLR